MNTPAPVKRGGYAEWAAEDLSAGPEDLTYANRAARGQLLHQILDEKLGPERAGAPMPGVTVCRVLAQLPPRASSKEAPSCRG
ncbi:hypothetical protein GCM10027038_01740 [Arthrobacter bambusae]